MKMKNLQAHSGELSPSTAQFLKPKKARLIIEPIMFVIVARDAFRMDTEYGEYTDREQTV